jgi:hypothetical protein
MLEEVVMLEEGVMRSHRVCFYFVFQLDPQHTGGASTTGITSNKLQAKETYYRGKRDLQAKETYYRGKRDLHHQ